MTSRSKGSRCAVPECGTWAVKPPICHQHRHIVGWRLAAGVETAYRQRYLKPHLWHAARTELLEKLKESAKC